jgi:two-component system, sensor histidine kinase and response regulator
MKINGYTAETGLTEKPFSILYVEDEQTTREIVAARLSRQYPGARIDTAENGAAGLEMFKEFHYDMVISDNSMPVMSGVRMVSEIRALRSETIILFLSFDDEQTIMERLTLAGSAHYLQKPFKLKELFGLINGCMLDCHANC